jgi:hypothetical protein
MSESLIEMLLALEKNIPRRLDLMLMIDFEKSEGEISQ